MKDGYWITASAPLLLVGLCFSCSTRAQQVQGSKQSPATAISAPGASDPLALGKAALAKEDFAAAQSFFMQYLNANPHSIEAKFYEGDAELGLKNYAAAIKRYDQILSVEPDMWAAHNNLVIAFAGEKNWVAFDKERAKIASAHAAHAPGIPSQTANVIDVFEVSGQRYIVREYDPPVGKFHTKYNFTHFGTDGKLDGWISCESDDIDQISFAKAHPKEAAAGKRSYSLDSYTAIRTLANGSRTQTHGTLKFYSDGEPTYEAVRSDVINVLSKKTGPMSSTTTTRK